MWDMAHSYVGCDCILCGTWLICLCRSWLTRMWGMMHTYVWHDSFVFGTWFVYKRCENTHKATYLEESCPTYEWVTSHIYVSHVSYMNHIWRKVEAGWVSVTHSCKSHELLIFQTWFLYKRRENTHKSHIPSVVKSWLNESLSLIHIWDMTHIYVGRDSFICGTWLVHESRENAHNS